MEQPCCMDQLQIRFLWEVGCASIRDFTVVTVTRVERVQKREPPPLRDDPAYGPRACNPKGDESFRADRMAWFERVTGESMEGCDLTQQWQRADRVARAFRADTRVSRKRWDFYCDDV